MDNKTIKEVILHDKECPLSICLNHAQKNEGSIMFKVVKCPPEYIEIRKRLRAQESALDTIPTPSIQDRTINDHLSMFVEVKNGKEKSSNIYFLNAQFFFIQMVLILQHLEYLKFIQTQHILNKTA